MTVNIRMLDGRSESYTNVRMTSVYPHIDGTARPTLFVYFHDANKGDKLVALDRVESITTHQADDLRSK